jgi:hypothetical protein
MGITRWSGRRLVGTWIAGAIAECVLIALPIAFFAVTMFVASTDIVVGGAPAFAKVDQRMAALSAIEATESRADLKHEAVTLSAPIPLRPGIPRSAMNVQGIDAPLWYAFPMAASILFYVFAIPVGLVAITFVWLISRISGSQPPPRTT